MKRRGALLWAGLTAASVACSTSSTFDPTGAGGGGKQEIHPTPQDASVSTTFACGPMPCPIRELASLPGLRAIVVDQNAAYVTQPAAGVVTRVPFDGSAVSTIPGQDLPWAIAVDDTRVYWTNLGAAHAGSVMQAPKLGGQPVALATGLLDPRGIAVDTTGVYVAVAGVLSVSGGIDGGFPDAAAVEGGGGLDAGLVDGSAEGGGAGDAEAGDGGGPTGTILRLSLAGGPPQTLARSWLSPDRILVDATHVFWTEPRIAGAARIMALPKGGGPAPQIVADLLPVIADFAMDQATLYWVTEGSNGTVWSSLKTGGSAAKLVTGQDRPTAIATNGSVLWWATGGANPSIMTAATDGSGPTEVNVTDKVVTMTAAGATAYWTTEGTNTVNSVVDSVTR